MRVTRPVVSSIRASLGEHVADHTDPNPKSRAAHVLPRISRESISAPVRRSNRPIPLPTLVTNAYDVPRMMKSGSGSAAIASAFVPARSTAAGSSRLGDAVTAALDEGVEPVPLGVAPDAGGAPQAVPTSAIPANASPARRRPNGRIVATFQPRFRSVFESSPRPEAARRLPTIDECSMTSIAVTLPSPPLS